MTEYETIIKNIAHIAGAEAGVPVYHAPSASAGEKIIYRCSPGKYDGDFETFTVTMRFISRNSETAFERAERVSRILCCGGERNLLRTDECPVFTVRGESGGSGYIGRTGHYFVLAAFEVKRRMPSSLKLATNEAV